MKFDNICGDKNENVKNFVFRRGISRVPKTSIFAERIFSSRWKFHDLEFTFSRLHLFINRFSRTKRNKPLKLYRFDLLGKSVLVYGKRSFRYKVWSTHEIEFPTFQFKMVSDFSAFLRYQIGDRQNKRMFGGVFVAGISNWRRFHQCRARFELIPTFQTLLSRQLVWILFSLSLSLSVSWELLCNFVSHSFHTAAERNITREHFRNCKPPGNGEAPTILARRPTLYFFSLGLLRLCTAFIAREI